MKLDDNLVVFDGGVLLWRSHALAFRYAEARAALWGSKQVVRKKAGLWHVRKAVNADG